MTPTPTDASTLAAQLERRITLVNRVLRASAHPGTSVAALLTLRRLEDNGPMRITDLAKAEGVAQPTMTGLVRRLEQDGLVHRTADPRDARAVRVVVTDAGRAQLDTVRGARAAIVQARLDALDPDALAALAAALPAFDALLAIEPPS